MELLYVFLVVAILFEVVLFLLLSLPSPTGVKGKVARFLENNRRSQMFLLVHLLILLLAVMLWFDCSRMEDKYRAERAIINNAGDQTSNGRQPLKQTSAGQSSATRCCWPNATSTSASWPSSQACR